jgi:hypothetical protein
MEVFEAHGARMDNALELFATGQSFVFSGVHFRLVPPDVLECAVESSWQVPNLTEDTARADLASAYRTLEYLRRESPRFGSLTAGRRVVASLFFGYGMGMVDVCSESGGEFRWTPGFPSFPKT